MPVIAALFFGLKAAVLAIVLEAVFRIGKRSLKNDAMRLLAAAAFIGIFFFNIPFPLIILGAAIIAVTVALIDLGAARRMYWPLALSVLVLQIPLAILAAFAAASWYQVGAAGWALSGLIALVTTAMIAITSPIFPRPRPLTKRSEGSP